MTKNQIPSKQEIVDCHLRITPFINQTSLLKNEEIDQLLGCKVFFKCENEQKIGAFKARGGVNAVLQLSQSDIDKGLVTHSSGNHAQAIAYAGNLRNAKTWVVMPITAPTIKIEKVKALGAEVIFCENTPTDRQKGADEIVVISGQATVAKEIIESISDINVIIPPVGGGGLLSGTGLSAHYFGNNCAVFGAEPEGAADAIYSFETGKVEHAKFVKTIADGLQTHLSERTLNIIKKYVQGILLVSEAEIIDAMKMVYRHLNIIIEPSAAVSFASLIKNKELFTGKKVALILTGGNLDTKLISTYLGI
jgi:threonine dehydratase